MADIRVNALPTLGEVAAEDILHILDASTTNDVDSQTTVDAVADWIIANKSVRITGIDDVPGLRAALDGKADIVHTHTVAQVIGLQADLDAKTDVTQAQIIGRNIVLNGKSINVPSTIGGLQDDRIPDTVLVGDYLQFGTTGGGINNITGDVLKGNLALNLVDNTTDINKPISTATQTALDLKVDTTTFNTSQNTQDNLASFLAGEIVDNTAAIALNTAKVSFDSASSTKLAGIEAGADVTDTGNVWGSLGISGSGSTNQVLTQRGVFVDNSVEVTKAEVDAAIGSGTLSTDYYASDKTWKTIPTGGGGGEVTKAAVDTAIGVFPTGDSAQFYNEQGNFIDAVYDSIENAPIIRNATIETITIAGTRTNVQVQNTGTNEFSTITMLDSFNPVPTQYTTTFTSPNTTFTPALVLPTGSQGRQLSLTELDGTVHRFCYLVNGNYRLLAGGLTGTVRLGPVAVATTATVTAAVTVPDQTAGQTITLVGNETGTFAVGDFISPQANNFGAFRGIFIDSITFDGTNTVIVGPSNGATTFNTTSVLRNAGPATEIQGTASSFSYDPDTADAVYSTSVPTTDFTNTGTGITAHLTQIANAIAALETAITWDGSVTDNGDGTSSVLIDLGTETNIDSSFTITGGLNNMNTLVNTDGVPGVGVTVATTVTVLDPEATEVASQTFGVSATTDNNVDAVGNFINDAVNNNTETPIDFVSQYGSGVLTLQATEAGNTNPWTIVINNNGATAANAGNLSTSTVQTGELVNQMERLSVVNPAGRKVFELLEDEVNISNQSVTFTVDDNFILLHDTADVAILAQTAQIILNGSRLDKDFSIRKQTSGDAYNFDAGNDVTTINSDTINFVANTITGLPNTTVTKAAVDTAIGSGSLATDYYASDKTWRTLPTGATPTTVLGTANEIDVATVTSTATVSLSSTITDAITANTSKTGITTAQANAITANTAKTGISTAQATAITNNTAKVGITTAQATAITNNTAKTGITTAQASAITTNTAKVGITTAQASAITANTAKTGISTAQSAAIVTNTAKNSYPTADATKLAGIETAADVTDTANVVGSLTAGTNITIATDGTISAASGGTATTVLGTANEVDVNTVGNTATVSLDTAITSAITANTAKQSVAGLTQVGGAIVAADSVLYYDGTVPRRKVFSSVPLSIMNNDSGFTTNTGTVTNVTGTANEIDVATGTTTPVVSISSTVTDAITANTNKTGITTAQSSAITANTAKVGITTAQSDAIVANTAKQSVAGLTQVGGAIVASDSVLYYDGTVPRRKVFSSVPLSVFNNDANFGVGDAVLANTQTFTGVNTFNNTAGGIQVERITGVGDTNNYVDLGTADTVSINTSTFSALASTSIIIGSSASDIGILVSPTQNIFNGSRIDKDFIVRKQTNGNALTIDAGTDTFTVGAANIVGVASATTGTWTPTFTNGGTQGTLEATWSKVGQTVTLSCVVTLAAGGTGALFIPIATLPFTHTVGGVLASGTFVTDDTSTYLSGVMAISAFSLAFLDPSTQTFILSNEILGTLGFTVTYQTDD